MDEANNLISYLSSEEVHTFFNDFIDLKSIFNGVLSWVVTLPIVFIAGVLYYRRLMKEAKKGSVFQTCIYANHEYIVCEENKYIVKNIPEIMLEYRKKLYSTDEQEELFFWNTRISTYVVFTDGRKILVLDRDKNKDHQLIKNEGLDCYGAVKFHNPLGSLLYKLPEAFMDVNILKFEAIPGIALEQNAKKILGMKTFFNKEIAIMLGFIVYIKSADLKVGVKKDKNNTIIDLNCLSPDDENLTAKTRLAVKHLLNTKNTKKKISSSKKIRVKLIH